MSVSLLVSHRNEDDDNDNPIEIVGKDGSVRGGILPTEECIEDAPTSTTTDLRTAALSLVSDIFFPQSVRSIYLH